MPRSFGQRTLAACAWSLRHLTCSLGCRWTQECPSAPTTRLISFLKTDLGYKKDEIFLFGYDWRRGIESGANSLAKYVDDTVRMEHGGQIVFVAHSLGCLVLRWALTRGLIRSQKVKLVIAAGPPSLGSSLAFKSVVEMPALNDRFHRFYKLVQAVFAGAAHRLELSVTRSLMCLSSLMELMPPKDINIIIEDGGTQVFSAFGWKGWPPELALVRDRAQLVQGALETTAWPTTIPRKLVVSNEHPTETGYRIDRNYPFDMTGYLPTRSGRWYRLA